MFIDAFPESGNEHSDIIISLTKEREIIIKEKQQ